jgi:hypothetical protein
MGNYLRDIILQYVRAASLFTLLKRFFCLLLLPDQHLTVEEILNLREQLIIIDRCDKVP